MLLGICGALLALPVDANSLLVSFSQVLQSPDAYRDKRISIVGVAEVDGISFTLFQPPNHDLSHSIFVGQPRGKPRYNHLNNHWVKVTGIVEPDAEGIFAAKLFLDHVQSLSRPPVVGVKSFAIFINRDRSPVVVELRDKDGALSTKISLRANGIEKTVVGQGAARVLDAASAQVLSECPIQSESSKFFEVPDRTFYFQIKKGKIEPVEPDRARDIKDRWTKIGSSQ